MTYKYSDVAIRISFIHCLFEELSIKPGDKVAICDKNSSNWAVAMLATITYRAVAVPLLPDYSEKQLVELCEHCDAKFMIGSRRLAKLWPEGSCPMYLIDISDLLAMNPSAATDDVEERAYRRYSEKYPDGFTVGNLCYEADSTLKKMGMRREDIDLESVRKEINTHLPKYCQLSQLEQRDEEFEKTPKKSIKRFLYT